MSKHSVCQEIRPRQQGNIANEQYQRKLMFSGIELNPGAVFL